MKARCFYCGKLREFAQMKRVRVLTTAKAYACADKDLNDCNPPTEKAPDPENLTYYRCIP